ncbi:hypothetical protein BCR39DRAFT_472288 [Naematelia encephala]|uniref:NodB homology domain-containing protein n=1 Tax=Naematelia encephala TaxID=71784 RepID=A0A1Y2APM6_9TREE|nr:hypothetical protein BCR39DRAFT_472288 [Naematelia encephala]
MTFTEYTHERPLFGYELSPPDPKWPGGAKLAVTFVIEYTEGGEKSVEYGDDSSEGNTLHNELLVDISRKARDDMGESEWEYGPRAGLPRLLKMFKKYGVSGTINVVTSALEKSPYWAKSVRESGWELSCAGKRWIDYMHVDPATEAEHLSEAIKSIQDFKGEKSAPTGFCIGRRSNYSQRLYAQAAKEAGVPLLYSSDSFADELPFWLTSPLATPEEDEGLLIVPTTIDTSDVRFNVSGQGFATGADYLQYLTDTFKYMYAEGESGIGRMMVITLHPKIVGHGSRAYYLEQFVKFVTEQQGVWVAPRAEIAKHWRANFPYSPSVAHDKVTIVKNVNPYNPLSKPLDAAKQAVAPTWKQFLPPRDFTGYGLESPAGDVWPNGAKIAVSFVLNCTLR